MKKLILSLVIFILFLGARLVYAEVIINEVAWMGTSASQYEEWIELKNTGPESISLVGWKLYKNNETLLFSLSGTISAGEYFLICRTTPSISNPLSGICDEQGVFS
ncbi:MAG: lamin tail domain-containing protein, partial [Bacteroidales bacterium]